ncbi:MAG: hypothetical protein LQ352_003317 [Teloschistes flavicans]|nr:MAG: hypothetical protein LQ352_003317 [Teloschistes flavicans]
MSSTEPAQQSRLLRLPPEIRILVYSFLRPYHLRRSLWVCCQLYNETHRIFYEQFCLNLDVFSDAQRPLFSVRVDHGEKRLPYPLQTHKPPRKWSFQLHLGHGQNGNRVMDRLESMPEPSRANLKAVNLFVPGIWALSVPPIPPKWQHHTCLCDECEIYGSGLQPLLLQFLKLTLKPHVLVTVYYHTRSVLNLTPTDMRMWTSTDDGMLSLFKKPNGLPGCKRLFICCSQITHNSDHPGIGLSSVMEWAALCNTLVTIMQNGSFLEHLEVWIPEWLMRDTTFSKRLDTAAIARPLDRREINALDLYERLRFERPIWVHFLTKITGLKSVHVMLWKDYERTSQQSSPVKPLDDQALQSYLESKMLARHPVAGPSSTIPRTQ